MAFKRLFEEESGKPSAGRLCTLLIVLGHLAYAGYLVVTTKALPDIPGNIAMLAGALYGVNKVAQNVGK